MILYDIGIQKSLAAIVDICRISEIELDNLRQLLRIVHRNRIKVILKQPCDSKLHADRSGVPGEGLFVSPLALDHICAHC